MAAALGVGLASLTLQVDAPFVARSAVEQVVTITATDAAFDPEEIDARPGERLRVTLENHGSRAHGLAFELEPFAAPRPLIVGPGGEASLTMWAPLTPGAYEYFCPLDDEKSLGLRGSLVVGP